MKKLTAYMLAAAMAMAVPMSVSADEYDAAGDASMQVEYSVDPSYTVTIPSQVALANATNTAEISADNVHLPSGQSVIVKVASAQAANGTAGFNVSTGKAADDPTVAYTVTKDSKSVEIKTTEVLKVSADTKTGDVYGKGASTLTFKQPENVQFAGKYTGTITFSISVGQS